MKKKKNFTFGDVIYLLNEANGYSDEYLLDYFLGQRDIEPMPYDDYFATVKYGSNEGIYAEFYAEREKNGEHVWIGTAKTLGTSEDEYFKMYELAAKVCLKLRMVDYA